MQLSVINKVGEKLLCCLLLCDTADLYVAESVVGKERLIYLRSFSLTYVGVRVDYILVVLPIFANEPDLLYVKISVLKGIRIAQYYFLTVFTANGQTADARV